jgi:hypothetical protein
MATATSVQSLFDCARVEADRHKYLESEKAGRDLGLPAVHDWHERFWTIWLRHRWLEHLLGEVRYEEFNPDLFGALLDQFGASALLEEIADRICHGAENVDLLLWAARERRDLDLAMRILKVIGINQIRCRRARGWFAEQ